MSLRKRFTNLMEKLIGRVFKVQEMPEGKIIPINQDFGEKDKKK